MPFTKSSTKVRLYEIANKYPYQHNNYCTYQNLKHIFYMYFLIYQAGKF